MNNLSIKPTDINFDSTNCRSGKNLMLKTTETMNLTAENLVIIEPKVEDDLTLIDGAIAGTQLTPPEMASVLVVFDSRVQDLGLLYDAIVPGAVGYTIDAQQDALTEITWLLTQTGVQRLAIVAHGEPGVVHIGANLLNREQLQVKAHLLQEWGVEEIALYSCEVGKDVGFVAELERLTGATVAAAIGKVGSAAQGGSWEINHNAVTPIFKLESVADYQHILAITLNSISGVSGTDTYLNSSEAGASFTISGTLTLNTGTREPQEDVLIGVYSSAGNLLYWRIINNTSTTATTFTTSFDLGKAVGNYEGDLFFRFWQGTASVNNGTSSANYNGTSPSLPTATQFDVDSRTTATAAASTTAVDVTSPTYTLDTIAPSAPANGT